MPEGTDDEYTDAPAEFRTGQKTAEAPAKDHPPRGRPSAATPPPKRRPRCRRNPATRHTVADGGGYAATPATRHRDADGGEAP